MKTTYSIIAGLFLLCSTQLAAQIGTTTVNGQNPKQAQSEQARLANPSDLPTPEDGSTFLGPAYQNTACGLNYTTATNKLGQRLSTSCCPATNGVPQPATFTIAGIPATATVIKAFVWADFSGNGIPVNLNVTNPIGTPFVVPMPVVGGDVDKCWGYAGVYTYRADVTATISGNGNYLISGLPVDPGAANHDNDVDGATMMVIWMDQTAGYQGSIVIWDGAVVKLGQPASQTMSGFQACPTGNISNARGFAAFGDLQTLNSGIIINGSAPFAITEDWWNYVDVPTTVATGQNTAVFGNNQNSGDCYNFCLMGLYWQDNCNANCEVPCVAKAVISSTGCNPITFTGSNSGATPVTSWYWDFGDGNTSTLQNPTHTYAIAGTYKVCLTITAVSPSGQSCCDQVCTKVIACPPQPCVVNAEYKWEDIGHWNVQFQDISTGTGVPCGWFWDFGDGNTSTVQNPIHAYSDPGFYVVCMTVTYCVYDASGNLVTTCTGTFCKQISVGVVIGPSPTEPNNQRTPGGSTLEEAKKVTLYPNPTTTELFIVAQQDLAPTIRVRNSTGQQVSNKADLSARNLYKVNVETFSPGLYMIEVTYSNGTVENLTFVKK
jgi:PKD repeat protein